MSRHTGCGLALVLAVLAGSCARKAPHEGKSLAELRRMLVDKDPVAQAQGRVRAGPTRRRGPGRCSRVVCGVEESGVAGAAECGPGARPDWTGSPRGRTGVDGCVGGRRVDGATAGGPGTRRRRSGGEGSFAGVGKTPRGTGSLVRRAAQEAIAKIRDKANRGS